MFPNRHLLRFIEDFKSNSMKENLITYKSLLKKCFPSFMKEKNIIIGYTNYLPSNEENARRALVSYLCEPVCSNNDSTRFSNDGIARAIPRVLNEMGYTVDIVNWNDMDITPENEYDLFIGHGGLSFTKHFKRVGENTIVIYFSTGNHWRFHNRQEKKRFVDLQKRRNTKLPLDRYIPNSQSEDAAYSVADGIICLGNQSVLEPYSEYPLVLNLNNASYPDEHYEISYKNFSIAKKNFFFYSGGGNVHKGLDLLLEAFKDSERHLYICTKLEDEFQKEYEKELNQDNIHYVGWIRQRGKTFYEIIDKCAFIIFPSCSEGSAGSVVECMNQGLIPIVSRETRIDVKDFGFFLEECTVGEIENMIKWISEQSAYWVKERSLLTRKAALDDYSEQMFLSNIKECIQKIIELSNKARVQ